jgi:hypothetical protein
MYRTAYKETECSGQISLIIIADDYSPFPAGRSYADGPFSAERFRREFLVPALLDGCLEVNLDRTGGFASNWLQEAFGGLVTKECFSPTILDYKLFISSYEDDSLIEEIWSYIRA